MKWFQRHEKEALVFVDYEYWQAAMNSLYRIKPDIETWIAQLREEYELREIYFFADFFRDSLKKDVPVIRQFTNQIIETQCTYGSSYLKDMSDFIMLDFLYRAAYEKNSPPNFILFTGDGHFQSVVRLLVQEKKKNVVVYGIKDSFSNALKTVATKAVELLNGEADEQLCRRLIVQEFNLLAEKPDTFISFVTMVKKVSYRYRLPEREVEFALHNMLEEGLVTKSLLRRMVNGETKEVKVLLPQWDKLIDAGLHTP